MHTLYWSQDSGALADLDAAWNLLESELGDGPYLPGDQYSSIDPYLTMLAYWHEDLTELFRRCPRLHHLCEAVKARPACETIWKQHYPES